MHAQGRALRAIVAEMQAKGFQISHEGVAGVLSKGLQTRRPTSD